MTFLSKRHEVIISCPSSLALGSLHLMLPKFFFFRIHSDRRKLCYDSTLAMTFTSFEEDPAQTWAKSQSFMASSWGSYVFLMFFQWIPEQSRTHDVHIMDKNDTNLTSLLQKKHRWGPSKTRAGDGTMLGEAAPWMFFRSNAWVQMEIQELNMFDGTKTKGLKSLNMF